jgi:hypothetical protein
VNVKRMVVGLATVITAVIGLSLVTAGPAAAAAGVWVADGSTNPITSSASTWKCTATQSIGNGVGAQGCMVRAPGGKAIQGAVIVLNTRSTLYPVAAAMELKRYIGRQSLGRWECASAQLDHGWSVCFGHGVSYEFTALVTSSGANGVELGSSPPF